MITITLASHYEKISPENPFSPVIPSLLYHQYRTYQALKSHDLVINSYNTGTGKTRASLLHLCDRDNTNVLFIAPTNELIRQHVKDIQEFVKLHHLDFHVLEVNAQVLRNLEIDTYTFGNGERLHRLIKNPLEFAQPLSLDTSSYMKKPVILVVNPDIFYYALYFSYAAKDKRNAFEAFLTSFNYIVIDEFHYYNIKQLANFLFFFIICQEFDYFKDGSRKICLLSATPNQQVLTFLDRIGLGYEHISPDNEPPESEQYETIQSLGEVQLTLSSGDSLEALVEKETEKIRKFIREDGFDGAIISSALWKINRINQNLKDLPTGRITGAETPESRKNAQYKPLILATPTVDIGYNFEKHQKDRQNIDFLFFDGLYQDDLLQRLGRAGRTLGKGILDQISYAYAVTDPVVTQALQTRGQERYERKEFTALLKELGEKFPQKNDLQAYIRSYSITEAFYPIYQLNRIMPKELEERLHQLFEKIKAVFTPGSRRTFRGIWQIFQHYETQKRMLHEKDYTALRTYLPAFIREKTRRDDAPSSEELDLIYSKMKENKKFTEQVVDFVREKYELTHTLFNFRNAFQGPTACVYDPKRLLSENEIAEYDLFHLISNFECEVFENKRKFEEIARDQVNKSDFYLKLKDFRQSRCYIEFGYEANCLKEQFERTYCNDVTIIRNLNVRLSGGIPVDPAIRRAVKEIFIPCLIVKYEDRGALFRKKSLFSRTLRVQVDDDDIGKELEYPIILGTEAFLIHAELQGYFYAKYKKQPDECWIV